MNSLRDPTNLVARILLVLVFVILGYGKIGGYEGTAGYMDSKGVPGMLLPLVILLEVAGGALIVVGFFSRWIALALAGFSILSAILFHYDMSVMDFPDRGNMINFWKNFAIAGGMLMVFAYGPGKYAINDK
jgi:putative oxidoreductase